MKSYFEQDNFTLYNGDSAEVLKALDSASIDKCIYCKFYNYTMEHIHGDYGEVITFKCPVCTAPWSADKIRNGKCMFFILNRDHK